jgi:4-diphosphocytidyl-2-C-methyl-D-erythritol kinase
MITIWPAPAKLNLFLHITGKRCDGYHNIQTIFQLLDYGDSIYIDSNQSSDISLYTEVEGIHDKDNLVIRAAKLLKEIALKSGRASSHVGASIEIRKRIPIGGGLGGGSSNAATTIVALNYLWKTKFSVKEMASLGVQLGADIPLFIHGNTSFSEGIGDSLVPIDCRKKWYLVIFPGLKIETKTAFTDPDLYPNSTVLPLVELLRLPFRNDFESLIRKRFQEVDEVMSIMSKYLPRLTGTGSCVFTEFDDRHSAYQASRIVPSWANSFVTHGVGISPLHLQLYALEKDKCARKN